MRDPFNLSKPPASNPEPIWIKQPLSHKMRDPALQAASVFRGRDPFGLN